MFGSAGKGGKLVYVDIDGHPHRVDITTLPWSHTETTTLTVVSGSISAQVHGGQVGCRMLVDGVVRDEQSDDHEDARRRVQSEIGMSEHRANEHRVERPFIPRMVRLLAIPIIVFWALLAVTTNTFVPQVEEVAEELAGPMVPHYAPSQRALLHIGEKFHESNSTNLTMVVFEANRPLGDRTTTTTTT